MPFLTAVIVGGVLAAGGAAISGIGQGQRRKALKGLQQLALAEYEDLASEYSDLFEPIWQRYSQERSQNINLYRTEMERARSDFTGYFEQARSQYAEGMDRALAEMRTGRESTIALSRQETQRQQQRATAMNAFTGLGQTSFGSQRIEAIGRQGVLQEGAITEQYASQLSALEAQRAQGLSSLSAQMGQGLAGIQQVMAGNLSNIYQTYSGNIANMRTMGLGNQFNIRQQGFNTAFQYGGQAANLAGYGASAFGSAMGSIGGAVLGAGLGGMMAPAAATAGAAASTTGIGTQGGFSNFSWNPSQGQYMGLQGMPMWGGG